MSYQDTKILCIYPYDKTTLFLKRIVSFLRRNLAEDFYCYKIQTNELSHTICLDLIRKHKGIVLFLGHGRSDALFGACGDFASSFDIDDEAKKGTTKFYSNESFINHQNIDVFSNKIIFSFSCNSNAKEKTSLGNLAVQKNAKSFIGFGDIQTDYSLNKSFSKREIGIFKGIITRIIKESLFQGVKTNLSVAQLNELIRIKTNKEIHTLIKSQKGLKYRYKIATHLYHFKNEIEIFGNKYLKIFES